MLSALLLAAALTGYVHPEALVDTAWVAAHAKDADVRIIDTRRSGFAEGHIPGAVWVDEESLRDPAAPAFLLAPAAFEQVMGRLGISNGTRVILYDDRGGLLAARVWLELRAYGHSNVALLNGGWVQWSAEHRPVTTSTEAVQAGTFKATLNASWLAAADEVKAATGRSRTKIVDARTVAEMDGSDTRLSSRGGVIPAAVPVYWEELLDATTKTFKAAADIAAIYEQRGIKSSDEVITYCWTGHRAAVDLFALHLIGYDRLRVYLGSWQEWSSRMDLPTTPYRP